MPPTLKNTSEPATPSGVFTSVLGSMHRGQVVVDLDDAIRQVTQAVSETQKPGELTLKLKILPNGVGTGEVPLYKVEEDIKVKLPKVGRKPSVFFADADHNLTRRNPKQEEIAFAELPGGAKIVDPMAVQREAAREAAK